MMVTSVNRDTISAIHTHQENWESPRTNNADLATAAAAAVSSFMRLLAIKLAKLCQDSRAIHVFTHGFVSTLSSTPCLKLQHYSCC